MIIKKVKIYPLIELPANLFIDRVKVGIPVTFYLKYVFCKFRETNMWRRLKVCDWCTLTLYSCQHFWVLWLQINFTVMPLSIICYYCHLGTRKVVLIFFFNIFYLLAILLCTLIEFFFFTLFLFNNKSIGMSRRRLLILFHHSFQLYSDIVTGGGSGWFKPHPTSVDAS